MTCKHLRRQRRLAWIAACAVTLSVFGVGYTKKAKPGTTFSLMTWNIIHGNGMIDKQKSQLSAYSPDIALLQEVDIGTRRINRGNNMTDLADGLYDTALFGYECDYDTGMLGTALLTDGALSGVQYMENRKEYAEIHNGYFHADVELSDITVSVYAVHLNYARSDWRAQQLYELALDVSEDKSPYVIVAGDFNLHDFSELSVLSERLTALNREDNFFATYHGLDWHTQAIDNILYTADTLSPSEVVMPVNGYSDHNALYASFTVLDPKG